MGSASSSNPHQTPRCNLRQNRTALTVTAIALKAIAARGGRGERKLWKPAAKKFVVPPSGGLSSSDKTA